MRTSSAKPRSAVHLRKDPPADTESDLLLLHTRLKDVVASLIEYADLTDTFLSSHSPARDMLTKLTTERTKWENFMIYALGVKEVSLRRRFHMPSVAFEGDFGKVTELLATTQSRLSNSLRKSGFDPGSLLWDTFSELNQRFWDQFFAGKQPESGEDQTSALVEEQTSLISQLQQQLKASEREIQTRDQAIERLQGSSLMHNSQSTQQIRHMHLRRPSPNPEESDSFSLLRPPLQQSPVHLKAAASRTLDLRSLKDPLERVMQDRDQLKGMIRSRSPSKTMETAEAEHSAEKQKLRAVIADLRRQITELKGESSSLKGTKSPEEMVRLEKERSQAFFKALRVKEKECEELTAHYHSFQSDLETLQSRLADSQLQAEELKKRDGEAEHMLERTSAMLRTLKEDKEMQSMEIKQLKAANGVLEIKNQRAVSKIANLERKIVMKSEEFAAIQSKLEEIEDIQGGFESMSTLKSQISAATRRQTQLEEENKHLTASLDFTRSQLEKTVQAMETLRREGGLVQEDVESFQDTLDTELKALEDRFTTAEKRLKTAENSLRSLAEKRHSEGKLRAEIVALQGQLETVRARSSSQEGEIQAQNSQIQSLQASLQTQALDLRESASLQQLSMSQDQVKRLSESLERVDTEMKKLKGEKETLVREKRELEAGHRVSLQQLGALEKANFEGKEDLRELGEELRSLQGEKSHWLQTESGQKEHIRRLKSDLEAAELSIAEKSQEIDQLQQAISAANKASFEARIQALENELKTAQKDKESARKDLQTALQSHQADIQGETVDTQRTIKTLGERLTVYERENSELKDNALATTQKVHSLQQDLKARNKEIARLTTEKADLEEAFQARESQLTAASEANLRSTTEQLTESLASTRAELEERTDTLSNLLDIGGVATAQELAETLKSWSEAVKRLETVMTERRGKIEGDRLDSYIQGLENEQVYLKNRVKTQKAELESEIEALKRQLKSVETSNSAIAKTKSEHEDALVGLTAERDKLSAQLAVAEAACAQLRQAAAKDREETAKGLEEARTDTATAERLVERLNAELSALQAERDKSTKQLKTLEFQQHSTVQSQTQLLSQLQSEKATLHTTNTTLQEKVAELEAELAESRDNLVSMEEALAVQKKMSQEALEKATSEQQSVLAVSSKARVALENDLKKAVEARKILQGDVKLLENELKNAENDLEKAREDLNQSQKLVISLQHTNQSQSSTLNSSLKEVSELKQELAHLHAASSSLTTEKEGLLEEVKAVEDRLTSEREILQRQCQHLTEELAQVTAAANKKALHCETLGSEVERIEGSLKALQAELEAVEAAKGKLEAANRRLTQEAQSSQQREAELSSELQTANSHMQSSQTTLERDLQEARKAVLTEKKNREALETALRAAEEVKAGLEIDCRQRDSALETAKIAYEQIQQRLKAAEEQNSRDTAALATLRTDQELALTALQKQLAALQYSEKAALEAYNASKSDLSKTTETLKGQLKQLNADNQRLQVVLDASSQEKTRFEGEIDRLKAQIEAFRQELAASKSESAAILAKSKADSDSLRAKAAENAKLTHDLATAEQFKSQTASQLETLRQEQAKSRAEITQLQKELTESRSLQRATELQKAQAEAEIARLKTLTEEISLRAVEKARLESRIEGLSAELDKVTRENGTLKAENREIAADLEESTRIRRQNLELISSKEVAIKALETAKSALTTDLRTAHSSLSQLQLHQQSLLDRIAELEEQLASGEIVEEEVETAQRQELEVAAGLPANVREIELSMERESLVEEELAVPIIYYSAGTSERVKKEDMRRIAAFLSETMAKMTDKMNAFLGKLPEFLEKIPMLEQRLQQANSQIAKLKAELQREEDEVSNPEAPRPSLSPDLTPCVLVHYEGRAWVLLRSAAGEYLWQEPLPHTPETAPVVVSEEILRQLGLWVQERNLLQSKYVDSEEKALLMTAELRKIRELLESRGFNFQGESLYSVINSISLPRKRGPASSQSRPPASEDLSEVGSNNRFSPQAPVPRAVTSPPGHSDKMSDSSHSKALSEDESQQVFRTIKKLMKDNDELVKELNEAQRQIQLYKGRLADIASQHSDPVSSSEVLITVQNLLEMLPQL